MSTKIEKSTRVVLYEYLVNHRHYELEWLDFIFVNLVTKTKKFKNCTRKISKVIGQKSKIKYVYVPFLN